MEEKYLSHFLPYDVAIKKYGCLGKTLKEYQALLNAALEATSSFRARGFEKFDALVGENACQIRAIWIAIIALKASVSPHHLRDAILVILKKIQQLLEPTSIDLLILNKVSFKDLLEREELDLLLTSEQMILFQAYFLTEMKIVKNSGEQRNSIYIIEICEPKKFIRYGDITTSFARKLLNKLRKMLATESVQFVRSLAYRSQDQSLVRMVSEEFTALENTLPCIPMFWSCKAVFQAAQEEGISLVIHAKFIEKNGEGYAVVNEDYMIFEVRNGEFVEASPSRANLNKPACVIQGVVASENGQSLTKAEWKERMRETSVIDVILAGAADHRQFPDVALDARIEHLGDSEYESYKAMAKRNGFSDQNPTTFFIQHVYAATVDKVVKAPEEILNLGQLRELILRSSAAHCIPRRVTVGVS